MDSEGANSPCTFFAVHSHMPAPFSILLSLACSFSCIKRNKLLTHHMLIPSHYLPLGLFLLRQEKGTSLTKVCIFFAHPSLGLFLFVHQKEQPNSVMHFIRPLLFCINPDLFLSADMFVRACWESLGRTWSRNLVPRPA